MAECIHTGKGSRKEFWRGHIRKWASSGQTVVAYCRAHQLSKSAFHFWKGELKRRDERAAISSPAAAFVELQMPEPVPVASIEIAFGGGRRVQVHPGFDEETLARVLAVLERVAC